MVRVIVVLLLVVVSALPAVADDYSADRARQKLLDELDKDMQKKCNALPQRAAKVTKAEGDRMQAVCENAIQRYNNFRLVDDKPARREYRPDAWLYLKVVPLLLLSCCCFYRAARS